MVSMQTLIEVSLLMNLRATNAESRRPNVIGDRRNAAPVCEQDSNVYTPNGRNEPIIQRSCTWFRTDSTD
jgi:hypothetical protein